MTADSMFTVGFQTWDIEGFLGLLRSEGVRHVIDVRRSAASRQPSFRARELEARLKASRLDYTYLGELGPRRSLGRSGNARAYFDAYRDYLLTRIPELMGVSEIAESGGACLMCYEADFHQCHRWLLAGVIADSLGLSVVHLPRLKAVAR